MSQAAKINCPALRYTGGKWRLASWVIKHLPSHRCYVEPFMGGASVLLRKPRSIVEVLNDKSDLVVTFFRVLRDRGDELRQILELTPFALQEYRACDPFEPGLDDIERARRFFVNSWEGYAGTSGACRNRGWRRTPDRNVVGNFAVGIDGLQMITERLRHVAIDCLDYGEILERYDRPDTCFFADPPYVLSTRKRHYRSDAYGALDWSDEDHVELLSRLQDVEGAVVLSGYGSQLYEDTLSGWETLSYHTGKERLWIKQPAQQGLFDNTERSVCS